MPDGAPAGRRLVSPGCAGLLAAALCALPGSAAAASGPESAGAGARGASYLAHSSDDEERGRVDAAGRCGVTSRWRLRVEARDGVIRVEFEMSRASGRAGPLRWRVVLLHERRIVARAVLVTRRGSSARLRRQVPDYPGADAIAVRAVSASGEICPAGALL
jgi:hypothetical protein